ncbi:hypothetical protein FD28_GL001704 [Levilactobacillus hammesii DSM 16381]|uniref:Calcineurin-like phosphoesterase domain-containing protein n=1 Tax=Levilactobacillus hammesii DSM 16381 TaxID=1423753 RepID=A0A0R1V3L1_9LACO|nr:hypothetical protein FD28_GL001704 [Levilactobacillus hammesii DSM 16381]
MLHSDGTIGTAVNSGAAPLVKRLMDQLMRQRVDAQGPIILAVNLLSRETLRWFRHIVRDAWGYEIVIVDALAENENHLSMSPANSDDGFKQRLPKYLSRYQTVDWTGLGRVISPAAFLEELKRPLQFIQTHPKINRLVIFSDVHGDAQNLQEKQAELTSTGTAFAFLGDAIDRGTDSAGVIRTLLARNDGFQILGNHEHRLLAWYQEQRISQSANDFSQTTLPQLNSAGITRQEIHQLIDGMGTYHAVKFAGKKLLLSHAGLEPTQVAQWCDPQSLTKGVALAPTDVMTHGLGDGRHSVYTRDIDQAWADSADVTGMIAIHGHRNRFNRDVVVGRNLSFNLTDADGETFRYLILTAEDQRFEMHIGQRYSRQERVITGYL